MLQLHRILKKAHSLKEQVEESPLFLFILTLELLAHFPSLRLISSQVLIYCLILVLLLNHIQDLKCKLILLHKMLFQMNL
jgi:hypothetical protein